MQGYPQKNVLRQPSLTTPYGATIQIYRARTKRASKATHDITAPGDGGATVIAQGDDRYEGTFIGILSEGATVNDVAGNVRSGTLNYPHGTGEMWSGACVIPQFTVNTDYTTGGDIIVQFTAIWSGPVTLNQPGAPD